MIKTLIIDSVHGVNLVSALQDSEDKNLPPLFQYNMQISP